MFVTFTEWEFDNIDAAQATARSSWPTMQAAGATNFKATQIGENTVRSMTLWPDSATAHAAIDKLRAAVLEQMSGKVTGTSSGNLILDLS
mgnify:CR=1 FL=1